MSTSVMPAGLRPSSQRWLARAALLLVAAAPLLLVAVAGTETIAVLLLIVAGVALVLVGGWVFLSHRGVVRYLGAALALGAFAATVVIEVRHGLLWAVLVCTALVLASLGTAHAALRPASTDRPDNAVRCPPPQHAFLIMNPRSGGGKVERFGLRDKATELGAEVALLDGPEIIDVAELARHAIEVGGADLVGVAGGDGTQALVAGVAAAHDVPLMVIPAGTRNHFALDLGLDRDDPAKSLDALTDGVEIRVDLGDVDGRPFVNNVSFGAYADIVARPDYRDDKLHVTLDVLPDVLSGHEQPRLTVHAGATTVTDPEAALVSNNPYAANDVAGMERRARLDGGVLGLIAIRVANAREAAGLLRGRRSSALTATTAESVVVETVEPQLAAGIDGETVMLTSPVECRVRPGALRVRVPRQRPPQQALGPAVTFGGVLRAAAPRRMASSGHGS